MALLQAGRKIEAIKVYRNLTGQGLKAAKETVEQLERGQPVVIQSGSMQASNMQMQVSSDMTRTAPKTRSSLGCLITLLVTGILLLALVVPFYFTIPEVRQRIDGLLALTNLAPFIQPSLTFGAEGSGPGYFVDARTVGVDAQGRIFVGDYLPGRIQAFDANGNFLWQHLTEDDTGYVNGLATDLNGKLYALVGREIHVFAAETGELVAAWESLSEYVTWYELIAVTPIGEIVAIDSREFARFDAQGNALLRVGSREQDFIETVGVSESGVRFTGLAVDGAGNLYLSTSKNFVLKLDENGKLIDRLPGALDRGNLAAVAVDGQGNIAWVYTYNPVISDQNSQILHNFSSGFLSDAEFNLQGQLVGISRNPAQVEVYTISGASGQ
jgi:hypothetical protein